MISVILFINFSFIIYLFSHFLFNLQQIYPKSSKCKIIQEEGSENQIVRPLPPKPPRQGWKVLRESIKRKEFQQGLRQSGKVFSLEFLLKF